MTSEGSVRAEPIKGTARRSTDPERDRDIARALARSEKDRAENIMIVDLLRNDLSRVCQPESVIVSRLCDLEKLPNLHHLVSTIEGQLAPACDVLDLLGAVFPGGSVTGAPKLRAMEIIDALRAGCPGCLLRVIRVSLVLMMPAISNIMIRTIDHLPDGDRYWSGAGLTLLSDAEAEWAEVPAQGGTYPEFAIACGGTPMILVLNNRDSFVFNLARCLTLAGADVEVEDSGRITISDIIRRRPEAIVISPGPSRPEQAGVSIAAVQTFGADLPILGVCLGHQVIAAAYGGSVRRALTPSHGRTRQYYASGQAYCSGGFHLRFRSGSTTRSPLILNKTRRGCRWTRRRRTERSWPCLMLNTRSLGCNSIRSRS